uniref:Uncharacterized protein n=1 Tax=Utricularia reniformis TaxID=192314 RepID=A0A1Y0B2M2_9LAMI|nr:hypothetical protein AEK19_MT1501 [Utricularia reniformis]ART31692.1 hypothetical protein AEK19_MT1501 [Utricularia reniformis]
MVAISKMHWQLVLHEPTHFDECITSQTNGQSGPSHHYHHHSVVPLTKNRSSQGHYRGKKRVSHLY